MWTSRDIRSWISGPRTGTRSTRPGEPPSRNCACPCSMIISRMPASLHGMRMPRASRSICWTRTTAASIASDTSPRSRRAGSSLFAGRRRRTWSWRLRAALASGRTSRGIPRWTSPPLIGRTRNSSGSRSASTAPPDWRAPPTRCTSMTSCSTPVRATRTGTDSATWTRRRECTRCRSPPAPCPPRFRPPGRPQSTSMRRPWKALSNGPGSRWRSIIPGRTISRSKSACPIDPDLPPSCCGIRASTRAGPRSSSPRAEPPSEGPSTSAAKLGSPIRSSTST